VLYVLLGLLVGSLFFLAKAEEAGADNVGWWVALVLGIAIVAGGVGFATMGIFLSPAGVTVRNLFRTYRIPWGKVVDFELDRNGLSLHTKDDVIPCWSYFSPRAIPQFSLDLFHRPAHTELQAAVAEHAGATVRLAPRNGRTRA
jgi:Bacterial PH domain